MVTVLTSEILLKRLTKYAINCQMLTLILPRTEHNIIYGKQLIRSSSSPAANYIEAIEAPTGKEFAHRLKVSRKETRETNYWLEIIKETNLKELKVGSRCDELISEGTELMTSSLSYKVGFLSKEDDI
ncbi:hypothetical protein A2962_04260 [Candidatus Woesebacteria bacterium RIFCSPLOWO2_01_FULL_39_61]|uniref:Four helix bundle protein n=1 Tax=Candidatus Woesebacteria bacterium RIFCSPHIGHO2_02_FULL_39_13 TaxID=1802505 RepID=A0A1F7YY30_9BACT|nr:MAG: hypothetical protein A2692_05175 [Candidatus Woesebacteria bacterium RIFCSPHIGHO2_01_FULL_39_95]OGM32187.1 MAG: hypothetical protein A3D01_02200 [Candidatus Woesebacteria bacterium RIFCSPHIGHO2_02_FULL_39_13]OGM36543.1 MAG: hypothetical protein A3E13_04235 [Candidatus Woesebacteria bacterium RIFCSPHIGHO2_12_FULL_40_20]OGM65977.1 MAG: hypothetical protein A2962_04260 [Candidatus Woesebacteria bacterium RIFCSPLOWO2_01_FULL_39_61]OGM71986.1 MAG: hypothetical protein A3H19_01025 [Candidatus